MVENLRKALANPGARDEALGRLRGLIERIETEPVEDGFEIEFTGEIARMVELSLADPDIKKAVLDERTAFLVKLVAGARNHRELTLRVSV